ncbi:MAG: hypothetical protein V3U65_15990 [Granulosicoccaceae bacterium]
MRDFGLDAFFSQWEITAKHHMTASDLESISVVGLLALSPEDDQFNINDLWLGYTETWGTPDSREEIASTYNKIVLLWGDVSWSRCADSHWMNSL